MPNHYPQLHSTDAIREALAAHGYIAGDNIAVALFLAARLGKPLLVEGPPGVGKTELAKTAAAVTGVPLIRLQCYEGIDEARALYEWKYGKQLLYTQLLREHVNEIVGDGDSLDSAMDSLLKLDDLFFSEHFLEPRPLLKALRTTAGAVLLIDEVDKSEEEFEAMLLEVLSDFQVSIPEIGTVVATVAPLVLLTSNSSREMSDALRRRCLHLYIPFPDRELETTILRSRVPALPAALAARMAEFIDRLRGLELRKQPAISETIDWAESLLLLHARDLDPTLVRTTLRTILKHREDAENVAADLDRLLAGS